MASATFEEHPTDPDKMILRKPRLDQGPDYERGFVDGMLYQMQTSVDKAVNAMSQQGEPVAFIDKEMDGVLRRAIIRSGKVITPQQRTWVGLTDEEIDGLHEEIKVRLMGTFNTKDIYRVLEAKLKEKNYD